MGIFDKQPKDPFISAYKLFDKKIICPNCGNEKFQVRDVLLNTSAMTFFGFDWANRTASALICTSCTRIEWYFDKPNAII
ncbi:MAG: DNA-binding protein [Ignavibacteria bacterium]|nr:DNA-binding protein [Ignavibacteria bacterium]